MEDISVVMKKVIGALLVITSLTGCGTTYYADRKIDTYDSYRPVNSLVTLVYNYGVTNAYSVPKGSRQEHEKCVFMILDNGQVGESCDWSTTEARGIVRIVEIKPNLCHTLFSTVYYKGNKKSFQDVACYTNDNNWKFIGS
jgi:hypothetical protein